MRDSAERALKRVPIGRGSSRSIVTSSRICSSCSTSLLVVVVVVVAVDDDDEAVVLFSVVEQKRIEEEQSGVDVTILFVFVVVAFAIGANKLVVARCNEEELNVGLKRIKRNIFFFFFFKYRKALLFELRFFSMFNKLKDNSSSLHNTFNSNL